MLTLGQLIEYAEVYRYAKLTDIANNDYGIPIVHCYVMEVRYLKHGSLRRLTQTGIGFGSSPSRDIALWDGFKTFVNMNVPELNADMLLRPGEEPIKVRLHK